MEQLEKRVGYLQKAAWLFFAIIVLRLFHLQVSQAAYFKKLSMENRIRLLPEEAPRGKLYDRNGRMLVTNRLSFNLYVLPRKEALFNKTLAILSSIMGIPESRLFQAVEDEHPGQRPVLLREDITMQTITRIKENMSLSGAIVSSSYIRSYPYQRLASHIIGYIGKIPKEKWEEMKQASTSYKIGDTVGLDGIEKHYDELLRGREGGSQIEVDAEGSVVGKLGNVRPEPGYSLVLSIDADIQKIVEKSFQGRAGAVVIMDPVNGEIFSLLSRPSYNPAMFLKKLSPKEWNAFITNPFKPLHDRAISGKFPPGSIFKIITAAAALEEGKVTPNEHFFCSGKYKVGPRTFRCWIYPGSHGRISFMEGISRSCDVVFYQLAQRLELEEIVRFAKLFGLGEKTGVDLPGEEAGFIPTREWKKKNKYIRQPWWTGDTVNLSIGQGYLQTTVLQMAVMAAIVANGGLWVRPHVVRKVITEQGTTLAEPETLSLRLNPETIRILKKGMAMAVRSGTGKRAQVPGLSIAGKTGTAEDPPRKKPHAWFLGFAPVKNPKIVVVVFVEQGGKGGEIAAPIAGKILKGLVSLNKI